MFTRAISGILFLLVVISAIIYSNYTLLLLFMVIIAGASFELSKLLNAIYKTNINSFWVALLPTLIYLILMLLFMDLYDRKYELILLLTLLSLFFIPLYTAIFFFKDNILSYIFSTYFSMLYILLPFLFLTLGHKPGKLIPNYNYSYYLSFFILIWVNDTFAYLSGKFTGKHKLYENISPNKTIEGFIGGIIFTISAGFVLKNLHWIEVSNPVNIIALCLLISISATLGDLFESKLKRMAGVKDSGNIMPGHGGFLDRFDGLLFAAPVYIIFSNLF